MTTTLQRVKLGLVGVVSLLIVVVIMRAGFAEGGPWDPFEAAAVAILVVAVLFFKATDADLSTRQDGIALALLFFLCFGIVTADAIVSGERVPRDLLGLIGIGLVVAAAFFAWPTLSRRGDR